MRTQTAALLLFAIPLAACAEPRWQKSGTSEATLSEDLAACNKIARDKAARAGSIGLPPLSDPRFGAPSGPTQAQQRLQERQWADTCMREKGYALVPAGK